MPTRTTSSILALIGTAGLLAAGEPPPTIVQVIASANTRDQADFDDSGPGVAWQQSTFVADLRMIRMDPDGAWLLNAGTTSDSITSDALSAAYGINGTYHRPRVSFGRQQTVSGPWSAIALATVGVAGSEDARIDDSQYYSIAGLARYRPSKDFDLSFGALVETRFDRTPGVTPFVAMNWQIDEHWNLVLWDPADYGSRIAYGFTDTLRAGIRFDVNNRSWRLDEKASDSNGAASLQSRYDMVGLEGSYQSRTTCVRLWGGTIIKQKTTIRDTDGGVLFEDEVEPSPTIGLHFHHSF